MLSTLPLERAVSYSEALSRFNLVRNLLGLKSKISWAGRHLKTAKCILSDSHNEYLDFGYGKGLGKSARTGAAYEALEHYLSQPQHIRYENIHILKPRDYLASTQLRITSALETLTVDSDSALPFRSYSCLSRNAQALYPIGLSSPKYLDAIADGYQPLGSDDFDYTSMSRYSTNNGVAIGCTQEEAIIHGLLESVERHVFSNFLVSVFLSPDSNKVNLVNRDSLPITLMQLLELAEKAVGGNIILINLSNDFEIPVFMASMVDSPFPIDPAGFGASLSRKHAVLRSITELVQCFHVTTCFHPESVQDRDELVLNHLKAFPLHSKCASLKIMSHVRCYESKQVGFSNIPDHTTPIALDTYLVSAVSKIAGAGFDPYTTLLASPHDKIFLSHTFLDGQDHFFCVTEGSLVFPNNDIVDRVALDFAS